ncbi:MAG: glucose 1-dehydrogenase [Deltaproteobacteria bacterium]|nr:glucose 1-dehydrogenase [Deltaproteobacteria bacterium]
MHGRLEGRVAVITGGGNGIGRATALRFLAEGAAVVIADLNPQSGEETLALANQAGAGERIRFVRCDVTREADIAAAIAAAPQAFGRLDCVFNNAGIAGAFGPIAHVDADEWDYTFSVLVRAVFLGMKHGARVLQAQGQGGCFINTASIAGLSGGDGPQAYSASKAAVINLSRAVAIELAPARIRGNAICPRLIRTPVVHRGNAELLEPIAAGMQPWPEPGRPEHIAAVALFLASDDARFVTGEALVADGGMVAVGANAAQKLGQGAAMYAAAGLDHGSTGQGTVLRALADS